MVPRILWFKEIKKGDVAVAGGKGASLGEMYNADLPIPPGFVVTTHAYSEFLRLNGIEEDIFSILDKVNVENNDELQKASSRIKGIMLNAEVQDSLKEEITEAYDNLNIDQELFKRAGKEAMDIIKAGREMPFVAVRSSASAEDLPSASFAGQMQTFLNIRGVKNIINAVRECWASLFTARAIFYRVENNFDHRKTEIAVIVQKMARSDKSGVIFSVNPTTNNKNEIVIEACYGLGEALVSGSINPDKYVIDKETEKITKINTNPQEWYYTLDINLGRTVKKKLHEELVERQKLNDYEIKKLVEFTKRIEALYRTPQDIEYAIEGSSIYIVQSRPVTTIWKEGEAEERAEIAKEPVLVGLGASPRTGCGPVKLVLGVDDLSKVERGDVLVTKMTNPDMVSAMKKATAIVTDFGGVTCHAAIVSREMGIPCVVGTTRATGMLKDYQIVTVDGSAGRVYEGRVTKGQDTMAESGEPADRAEVETVTEIKVVMDLPDFAEQAARTGADGVGLMRLEMVIAENNVHPAKYIRDNRDEDYVELLVKGIRKVAQAFRNKPVWVRTSDIRTDEYRNLEGGEEEPLETDPMIGWHGIRRGLDEPRILQAEFTAIKRLHDEGFTNIGVMIPFVINVDEISRAKEMLKEIGLEPCETIEFGVMIETPASCSIIEDICKEGIDFVSFGTNDLTQLMLGVDRNNEHIAKLFDEMHPAVLKAMQDVIRTCQNYNIETSICGQAGSNPEMAEFLVKVGIDSISTNPDAVASIRNTVAKAEKKLLLNVARRRIGV